MISSTYIYSAIAVSSMVTFGVRLLPFLLPKKLFTTPLMQKIAFYLPPAIMLILVVYGLGIETLATDKETLCKLAALGFVGLSYHLFRSMLISIAGGTALYILALHTLLL